MIVRARTVATDLLKSIVPRVGSHRHVPSHLGRPWSVRIPAPAAIEWAARSILSENISEKVNSTPPEQSSECVIEEPFDFEILAVAVENTPIEVTC